MRIDALELLDKAMPPKEGTTAARRVLFYGIGNVGREDDGLGIRLIENLEAEALPSTIELNSNYQLNIEDAMDISGFDIVVFVDATVEKNARAPFDLRPINPSNDIAFSTHAMGIESILALCDQLYGRFPQAFVLTMPGYQWEIRDELSARAKENLILTTQALLTWINGKFQI